MMKSFYTTRKRYDCMHSRYSRVLSAFTINHKFVEFKLITHALKYQKDSRGINLTATSLTRHTSQE